MGAEEKDFDYILDNIVGGGGRWQWTVWCYLIPGFITMGAPALLLHMFSAYTPRHRCLIEGCEEPTTEDFHASFLNFSVPKDDEGSNFLQ